MLIKYNLRVLKITCQVMVIPLTQYIYQLEYLFLFLVSTRVYIKQLVIYARLQKSKSTSPKGQQPLTEWRLKTTHAAEHCRDAHRRDFMPYKSHNAAAA